MMGERQNAGSGDPAYMTMRNVVGRVPSRGASVLVGLLWCLAVLAVVVTGLLYSVRLNLQIAKNHGDVIQARYLALAGIEKAKALLYQDAADRKRASRHHTGELYDAPSHFREVSLGRGQFSVFRQGTREEGGKLMYGIADEEGRLNLNQTSTAELEKLYGMTPEVVAAIRDWRDTDNEARNGGAEAEYYASLQPPYLPRNGPLATLREILMIRGIPRDLFKGEDDNLNGLLDPEEDDGSDFSLVDNKDGVLDAGWSGLLTLNSAVANFNAAGLDRINVQSADERELTTVPGITPEIAKAIVASRGQNQIENLADLLDVSAPAPEGQSRPSSSGPANNPPSPVPGPRRSSRSTPTQPTSPSTTQPQGPKVISPELLMEIADYLTTGSDAQVVGAINVNTASLDVLACLPGMTRELAQAIISYRKSAGFLPNVAYLLKVDGMTKDIFEQIAPKVTVRSETFRVLSEGTIPSSGARKRIEMILRLGVVGFETVSYREDL